MNKKQKKLKLKKPRRALDRGMLFPKKEAKEVTLKDFLLRRAFLDDEERQAYIKAILGGLDIEPIIPDGQFTR